MKSKKKKYFLGGNVGIEDALSNMLFNRRKSIMSNPGQIENPATAIAENDIAMAKAQSESSTPLTKGMNILGNLALQAGTSLMSKGIAKGQGVTKGGFDWGSLLMSGIQGAGAASQFATGGIAGLENIEAEGNEIVETPNGQMQELKGPSHENGGIDMLVPPGTEIFSDRLTGPDGKTMAERKKEREKKLSDAKKLYDRNPTDTVLKNTYNRLKKSADKEEKTDLEMMESMRMALGADIETMMLGGKVRKYSTGTSGVKDTNASLYGADEYDVAANPLGFKKMNDPMNPTHFMPGESTTNKNVYSDIVNNLLGGDALGLIGGAISTFKPMQNTMANRAGDQANINYMKDYGKEGLNTLDQTKQYVAGQRDKALSDLELSRSSAINRGRRSARGINTMRALDIATNLGTQRAEMDVYDKSSRQMQNILGMQAQMENQRDNIVMSGEQERDLADRQDRDNYFTQMARDIATKGYGLQHMGKMLNQQGKIKTDKKNISDLKDKFLDQNTDKISLEEFEEFKIFKDLLSGRYKDAMAKGSADSKTKSNSKTKSK